MSCATIIQRLHVVSRGGVPELRAKISRGFVDSDMPGNTQLDNSLDLPSSEVYYCVGSTLSCKEIICGDCDICYNFHGIYSVVFQASRGETLTTALLREKQTTKCHSSKSGYREWMLRGMEGWYLLIPA